MLFALAALLGRCLSPIATEVVATDASVHADSSPSVLDGGPVRMPLRLGGSFRSPSRTRRASIAASGFAAPVLTGPGSARWLLIAVVSVYLCASVATFIAY